MTKEKGKIPIKDREPIFGLNMKDYLRLLRDALVTVLIVLFIYVGIIYVVQRSIEFLPEEVKADWTYSFLEIFQSRTFNQYNITLLVVSLIILIFFVVWRLRRRRRLYELQHIIEELQYIARGNYSYRIQGDYNEEMDTVVDSINKLVDSTVEAMEEEREAERAKDELITNVSHDLRTPLTSVLGYLSLVENGQYESEDQMKEYVHIAYSKAQQMHALVNEIYSYATSESLQPQMQIYRLNIGDMLRQLVADFELLAKEKGKTIDFESESEDLWVKADADQLARVFQNILSNAVKYGEGGKSIHIQVTDQDANIRVSIANDGKPPSEGTLKKAFERFYRGDKSRSQQVQGSGLGLAIAKDITEAHQGALDAEVREGWTIFSVYLPKD